MNTLTPEEYSAIKKFAEGLKGCFLKRKKTIHDSMAEITLDYVLQIIDLHLQMKELELKKYAYELEKENVRHPSLV